MLKARYGNQDLWLPRRFHQEFVQDLVRGADNPTFSRQVDLWWYALGIGVSVMRRTPLPHRDDIVKIHDGVVLETDPWRITHLELMILAEEGQEVATNPVDVIQIANEYVMTGCSILAPILRGLVDKQMFLLKQPLEYENQGSS